MQTLQLGWQPAAVLSAGLLVSSAMLPRIAQSAPPTKLAPYFRESAIVAALYSLWQLAGSVSVLGSSGAFTRAHWIVRVENDVGLPSEVRIQRLIEGHSLLAQG